MTLENSQKIAFAIAGITAVAGLALVVDRNGIIAWSAFLMGVVLVVKIWRKPSPIDPGLGVALVAVSVLAWFGTHYYVINTWESGEVVELTIDTNVGTRKARLWVLDVGEDPLVYYDAPPEAAESLLAGTPLQFSRAGEISTRIPAATPIDALPEDEASRILAAMDTKYGDLNHAAVIYYAMLGRSQDRVALVASLAEE